MLILSILLSINCFEQTISFNSDHKSGFINYNISLKKDFYKIISFTDEKSEILKLINILQNENQIKEIIAKEPYLKFVTYKKIETQNSIEIYISLYFSDKEKLSFQFKNFIFPIYILEENKIIKCRVVLLSNILTNLEKLKTEYKYFIPKIIESETFEKNIIAQIKNNIDKENILKVYKKSSNNNYIFESKYPNIEKYKNDKINELMSIYNILTNIKFEIKEKEIFNSYAGLIKFKFVYKFPKPTLPTPQISPLINFSQDRKEIKAEYSLIDLLSSDKPIENEFSYRKD